MKGEVLGTLFKASKTGYSNKERWIRFSKNHGIIRIDKGASDALLHSGSLLPSGIIAVDKEFDAGVIVSITYNNREIAKGIVEYSSEELQKIKGVHTHEIEKILGYRNHESVVRRENMVLT
jgi:glutamate 5-kinase